MKPLIVLTGPTAVGKTDISIKLAQAVNGSIISADSMQIYKKMDIGTAKITKEEMQDIPHYLVDVLNPEEEFNVVKFKKMALDAMEEIYDNGRIPMVVGGTGFYIQALLYDVAFCDNDDDMSYRQELGRIADKQGGEYLHRMLAQVDPASAQSIHPNNIKRVIRALEFYKKTGKPISEHNQEERARTSPYNFVYFVLTNNRDVLYERIDRRVDMMLEQGLVDEVKALMNDGYNKNLTSMQGLGYKEIIDYLNGDISYEDAVYILKRDTRHFAKRQLTWFKREKEVTWVDKHTLTDDEQVMDFMLQQLRNKQIIGD